jgi:hypothetical protein
MNVIDRAWSALTRTGRAAILGASFLALVSASPAAAQAACQDGSNVRVEFLGVGTSSSILMAQTDGTHYQGNVRVRVYCEGDGALIPNSTIQLTTNTTAPGDAVFNPLTGQWESLANPVQVFLPTGELVVSLRTDDPNFAPGQWKAFIGSNTVTVTGAFGVPVATGGYPIATGGLWAQTPELSSLALFGTGAVGMAGYALTRLRARSGRRG